MTIEHTEIDGRPATICYTDDAFVPCAKEKATKARVCWADGDSAWLIRADDEPAPRKAAKPRRR